MAYADTKSTDVNVLHFIGKQRGVFEYSLIRAGWRQEFTRPHNEKSTVRKLIRPKVI